MGHKWGMTWGVNSVKLCGNSEEQGSTDSIPGQLAQERGGGGGWTQSKQERTAQWEQRTQV